MSRVAESPECRVAGRAYAELIELLLDADMEH